MKIILQFLKPYIGLGILTLLTVILDVAGALIIPTITANMINLAVSGGNLDQIIKQALLMLVVSIVSGASALIGCWLGSKLSSKVGRDIRNSVYQKSLTFSSYDFDKFGTASMITRTLNDINIIQQSFVMFIQMVLPVPIMCIIGVIFAFNINLNMGYLILGVMLFVLIIATIIVIKAAPIFEKLQEFLDRMNTVLRENIIGVRIIRAFNKEKNEIKRMKKTFSDYAESAIRANRLFAALDSLAMVSVNLCIVFILYIGGNDVGAGTMQIGDIAAVTDYAIWILFYIIMAQMVIILIPKSLICVHRVTEILAHVPQINDGPKNTLGGDLNSSEVIRFENVTFKFNDADEYTLRNLSFSCRRGEITAIVGGTGSGKSTIAKLLMRYYDVTDGRILLKNHDVREIIQNVLRGSISYVPQKAWLFSGTISDNLKYGNPNASIQDMYHALEVSQSTFINDLNSKLDSYVAQGGTNYSGGQKQRLSIARALIKKSDIYLFDDSFSSLDFKTDLALRKALINETKNAAVIIIAQRVSTILNAHQIIVLDDGKIVGIGTHMELINNCKVYRDIVNSQMKVGDISGG